MAFLAFLPAAIFGAVAVIVAFVSALADLAVRRAARRAMRPRRGFRLVVIEGGKRDVTKIQGKDDQLAG
jgi:hypothetical protein